MGIVNPQPTIIEEKPKPNLAEGQSFVCQISPVKFDSFAKILSVLDEHNIITINNSSLNQSINKGTATLIADISELVGKDINLHILQPKKYLRLFKQMKGNNDIFVIDDPSNERYIITNIDISLFLPKQIEKLTEESSSPDLDSAEQIGTPIVIDKDERSIITSFGKEAKNIDLLIQDNQLKAVSIPELAVIKFKKHLKENIDDVNADLKLRTCAFLLVDGEEYTVYLGKLNEQNWVITYVNTGLITITVLEAVELVSDQNLLI